MCNPKAGSPTITLFQLNSNYHPGLNPQKLPILISIKFIDVNLSKSKIN
jgi:hypothetical protein